MLWPCHYALIILHSLDSAMGSFMCQSLFRLSLQRPRRANCQVVPTICIFYPVSRTPSLYFIACTYFVLSQAHNTHPSRGHGRNTTDTTDTQLEEVLIKISRPVSHSARNSTRVTPTHYYHLDQTTNDIIDWRVLSISPCRLLRLEASPSMRTATANQSQNC